MKHTKQILTTVLSVLVSVGLVATAAYATTTVGNDVSVGGDLTVTGNVDVVPTRVAGNYAEGVNIASDTFYTGGASTKSYMLNIEGDREVANAATGDSNDAIIKASYSNYALNDNNFIIRGYNGTVNNRGSGTLGTLEGAAIGAQGKDSSVTQTIRGLSVIPENYGTVAAEFGGIDVLMKNEGGKATLQYGIRIRNEGANAGGVADAALLITDGASASWTTGIDLSAATVTTGIDIGDATTGINMTGTIGGHGIRMDLTEGADFSSGIYLYGSADKSIFVGQLMPETDTKPVEFYGMPTNLTGESSQGVLQICMTRGADYAMTSTTGNPDTMLRLRAKNEADNTVARAGLRGIDLEVENNRDEEGGGNAINAYIHAAMFTAGNTSDVITQCDNMQVLQLIMSNQGVVDTTLYGLRVLENSDGTVPTDTVGIKVTTSADAPAGGTRADGMMITTGGALGGWTDGLHIAGTITNAINIAGTHVKALEANSIATASGGYGMSVVGTVTDGASNGAAAYFEGHAAGTSTGDIYGVGTWLNVDPAGTKTYGSLWGLDVGVYAGAVNYSGGYVAAASFQTHVDDSLGTPDHHYMLRFNTNATEDVPDAWFDAANTASVAAQTGAWSTDPSAGSADASIKVRIQNVIYYIPIYENR